MPCVGRHPARDDDRVPEHGQHLSQRLLARARATRFDLGLYNSGGDRQDAHLQRSPARSTSTATSTRRWRPASWSCPTGTSRRSRPTAASRSRASRGAAQGRRLGAGLTLDVRVGRGDAAGGASTRPPAGTRRRPGTRTRPARLTGRTSERASRIGSAWAAASSLWRCGACASAPAPAEKTIEPTAAEDSAFVLSRDRPRRSRPTRVPCTSAMSGGAFRGELPEGERGQGPRARRRHLGEAGARTGFWDQQTSVETICDLDRRSATSATAAAADGGRRQDAGARWPAGGRGEGLFFGIRRPYADIFKTIYSGKIEKEGNRWKMPAWRGKLSKEQIWAADLLRRVSSRAASKDVSRPASTRAKTRNTSKRRPISDAVSVGDPSAGAGTSASRAVRHRGRIARATIG